MAKEVITNKMFKNDENFVKFCKKAGIEPTARQASKFRMGKGLAFKHRK
jgi:hypothetical protein